MLWPSRLWPTMASCRHRSAFLSPSNQFQMWAPRIFAVFQGVLVPALQSGLVALLHCMRSSPLVLVQSMMGTLALAATARGGVLITSCWIAEADLLLYLSRSHPIYISVV